MWWWTSIKHVLSILIFFYLYKFHTLGRTDRLCAWMKLSSHRIFDWAPFYLSLFISFEYFATLSLISTMDPSIDDDSNNQENDSDNAEGRKTNSKMQMYFGCYSMDIWHISEEFFSFSRERKRKNDFYHFCIEFVRLCLFVRLCILMKKSANIMQTVKRLVL